MAINYLQNPNDGALQSYANYWLTACKGDTAKVRKIRGEFERRIKHSNFFYSSYKEGWMTDRGMIYIIFGKPNYIVESHRGLEWHYNFSTSTNNFFLFQKDPKGIHPADFKLERQSVFYQFWERAVSSWANGDMSLLY